MLSHIIVIICDNNRTGHSGYFQQNPPDSFLHWTCKDFPSVKLKGASWLSERVHGSCNLTPSRSWWRGFLLHFLGKASVVSSSQMKNDMDAPTSDKALSRPHSPTTTPVWSWATKPCHARESKPRYTRLVTQGNRRTQSFHGLTTIENKKHDAFDG